MQLENKKTPGKGVFLCLLLTEKTVGWKEALFEEKIMLKKLEYFVPQTVEDYAIYAIFLFEARVLYEALFG